jgi:hypothetical protein
MRPMVPGRVMQRASDQLADPDTLCVLDQASATVNRSAAPLGLRERRVAKDRPQVSPGCLVAAPTSTGHAPTL